MVWQESQATTRNSSLKRLAETLTRFPKLRFSAPVRFGVFFFGFAPPAAPAADPDPPADEPEQPEVPQPPPEPVHSQHRGIQFINADKIPHEIRAAVARMHVNLGHPSTRELSRFLAMSNSSGPALAAVAALHCDACVRNKRPHQPKPPRIVKYRGHFGDIIMMDFWYTEDTTGKTHLMLGVINEATHLHIVRRSTS